MARGNKGIEGQLSFDFCLNVRNYVVQANNLISGKQTLKLNSAKLIRSAIMQIAPEDNELKPYILTINEFSELLGVSRANLYRDAKEISEDIIKHPVSIRKIKDGKTIGFADIPWVEICSYIEDVGFSIQLNSRLKPYLLSLKEHYTQYTLQEVLSMKSVYAIRIFELLQSKIMSRSIPKGGTQIEISVQEIRECCDCEDKYPAFANFRDKVIDKAMKEINRVTLYRVNYSYVKKGKSVVSIVFYVNMAYR